MIEIRDKLTLITTLATMSKTQVMVGLPLDIDTKRLLVAGREAATLVPHDIALAKMLSHYALFLYPTVRAANIAGLYAVHIGNDRWTDRRVHADPWRGTLEVGGP